MSAIDWAVSPPFITSTSTPSGDRFVTVKVHSLPELHAAHSIVLDAFRLAASGRMRSGANTRVRSAKGGWRVDRLVLGCIWVPVGRWIHQDWWAPYVFDSVDKALAKAGAVS